MSDTEVVMHSYDELKEMLHRGVYHVTFTKVDGTERQMRCTLMEEYLPKVEYNNNPHRAENDASVAVWDLDKDAWRSFRVDSLIDIYEEYL